jgi:hypoxanthine phosphoribosyltransferase
MSLTFSHAQEILAKSSILYSFDVIDEKIGELAQAVESEIDKEVPIFYTVMNGGMFFASKLLERIKKPFIADYIHASRYGNATFGSSHITWYRQPKSDDVKNRTVYILDDILDEGHTLAEITRFLLDAGAKECKIVVLVDKDIGKTKPVTADHIGFTAPNYFLFGFGMDIEGVFRQLPEIRIFNQD